MNEQDRKVETTKETPAEAAEPAAEVAEKDLDQVVGGLRVRRDASISDISVSKASVKSSAL